GLVRLREWDPGTAPAAEIAAWLQAHNAVLAVDLPHDPAWDDTLLREYLTETMPGERRLTWLAEEDGAVVGYGRLLLLQDLGVLEMFVVPRMRGQGVGPALLHAVADRALTENFTSLGVEVVAGTAATTFYETYGFSHVYTEMRSILSLTSVVWPEIEEM